jgi:hypothetical protein
VAAKNLGHERIHVHVFKPGHRYIPPYLGGDGTENGAHGCELPRVAAMTGLFFGTVSAGFVA